MYHCNSIAHTTITIYIEEKGEGVRNAVVMRR